MPFHPNIVLLACQACISKGTGTVTPETGIIPSAACNMCVFTLVTESTYRCSLPVVVVDKVGDSKRKSLVSQFFSISWEGLFHRKPKNEDDPALRSRNSGSSRLRISSIHNHSAYICPS